MFESPRRLKEDIAKLLEAIRLSTSGRYACVMDPSTILFETPEPEGREITTLRRLLDLNAKSIFELPAAMAREDTGPAADPFEDWEHDELLLAQAASLLPGWTTTGTRREVRDRLAALAAAGVTEIAYQPMGPDIDRELTAFAEAALGEGTT